MFIPTVTGQIAPADLGTTLIHEHIICTSPEFSNEYSDWLPRETVLDIALKKVRYASGKYNIKTIIDGTPLSLGRNLELLKEVSEKTNVNIIASAGFYFYPSFAQRNLPVDTLAGFMIREISSGAIKPAMLKCAVDADGMSNDVKKMMNVTAAVQLATGLPVFMHTSSYKRNGIEALELFLQSGVRADKIIVGHTGDADDLSYPLELLDKGCYVSVDRIKPENYQQRAGIILEIIKRGWQKQLFIAHDHICCRDTVMNTPPAVQNEPYGLDTIHAMVLPILQENGISNEVIEQIMQKNIINLYQG